MSYVWVAAVSAGYVYLAAPGTVRQRNRPMTDPWAVALLIQVSRLDYLQLGERKATVGDYQALMTWAQELNGWTVIVG